MKLKDILVGIQYFSCNLDKDSDIKGLSLNSKHIDFGDLFFAIKGADIDGNEFVGEALEKGAVAVITESKLDNNIPHVQVKNIRQAMAKISANFYDNAHKKLKVIAVIGTNGKTSTVNMIKDILQNSQKKVAVIGTLGAQIADKKIATELTTPDPIELHGIIDESVKSGAEYLIYEVSAHAIYLSKVDEIVADVAVFTNLSQDHLDFFEDMKEYASVKKSFFTPERVKLAVVNVDDSLGREIINTCHLPVITYGLYHPSDVFAIDVEYDDGGTVCVINNNDQVYELSTNFVGEFNVYNTLAAVTVAHALGISIEEVQQSYLTMQPPSGRFNILESTKKVVVDFAHTPDGLRNLLSVARKLCKGQIITVFGCGGNRDTKKRALMGKISAELSDFTIITSDNSRYEEPIDIIDEIAKGFVGINENYIKIVERENAIIYAILLAKPNDIVIIAGKGGEEYIEEKGVKKPFSDKKVVEETFRRYKL